MILAGLDVVRLNFSHGTQEDHAQRIALIRKLRIETGKPITILQDLQAQITHWRACHGNFGVKGRPNCSLIFIQRAEPDTSGCNLYSL